MERQGKTGQSPQQGSVERMAEEIFTLMVMGWRARLASKNQGTELSESQYLALDQLAQAAHAGSGPATVGEIQRAIGVVPAQMSRIISSLQSGFDKPLIRCELNAGDRRKIDVTLTSEGRAAYDEFRKIRVHRAMRMLEELAEEDRREFVRICARMRELYRAAERLKTDG